MISTVFSIIAELLIIILGEKIQTDPKQYQIKVIKYRCHKPNIGMFDKQGKELVGSFGYNIIHYTKAIK